MEWTDEGIVLGVRRHGESSAIVELLTRSHGRHLGLVRGGAGKRMRPMLQPGNSVSAVWRARLDEHLGYYVIEGTRYLLVEFSNYSVPLQTTDSFLKLGERGMTPVITHPERNPILSESPQRVVEWAEQGCVIQITGSALTGFWGERPRRAALWLLEHQAVHVLATDAHDMEKRVPILSTARDAAADICGEEIAEALVEGNPAAIVTNQPLPYFPRPIIPSYRKT